MQELRTLVLRSTSLPGKSAPRTSLGVRFTYGLGQISNSIKTFAFGAFLLFFYTSVMGLPGTLAGLATSISLFWDALIDPAVGHLSDRARFRFGRRHTFMLVGAIGMGVSFFAIFSPPVGLGVRQLFVWLVFTNILLRTSNSIFIVPYQALGAELASDYQERTAITGARSFLALLGTALAFATIPLFFPNVTPGVDPKFDPANYLPMALVFGGLMALTGLISTFGTLSQRHRLPTAADDYGSPAAIGHWASLKLALGNRSFVALTVSTAVFFLASVVTTTVAVHFLTYYLDIIESVAISQFQAAFFASAVLGVIVWLRLSPRWEKHRLYFLATLTTGVLAGSSYFLLGDGHLFGTGDVRPLLAIYGLLGFFASTSWFLPASMIADVADADRLQTGQNREGAYFGIDSFFQQQASGLAVLLTGILLDLFAGLVPGETLQSPETVTRIGVIFSLVPAALYVLAALLILPYRLTRSRVQAIQAELARHEETHEQPLPTQA